MNIAIGSDHAGWELKQELKKFFKSSGIHSTDFGSHGPEDADYPDYARPVAEAVARGDFDMGIIVCGTGIGSSIVANKIPGIRAAVCHDVYTAQMSRAHNDANILCLGGRVIDKELAREIVRVWLNTEFSNEERHARRVGKIRETEDRYNKS